MWRTVAIRSRNQAILVIPEGSGGCVSQGGGFAEMGVPKELQGNVVSGCALCSECLVANLPSCGQAVAADETVAKDGLGNEPATNESACYWRGIQCAACCSMSYKASGGSYATDGESSACGLLCELHKRERVRGADGCGRWLGTQRVFIR
ncbi:hypothetical protein PC129_g10622 [Phytophthora cactorum]|uniref:Uncharacterized protein n=1 Tax=Phytophthora cactorum TaxID=29920 RepID=A0A329S0M9_9STRA|nr:hypothetical protein Pcac1_g20841 [Phytophthora cactorum]KAG2819320.1 hypothetical protein PC112_g12230 [Phytophthora cactorum]KAG2821281.1 hypothetical protein PC111_g11084 [Phytophthora cactorum]KAG2855109.1 hypothetical protein PC113_g12724 [Phytophthora cactorum]KAG2901027.1 hypothetical protein PC114_g13342 [Phytophthora cactorum]